MRAGLDWLSRAQDVTGDGGVSAWYSLLTGWQPSYIETTGYIINTFFDYAEYLADEQLFQRAIKMADFLLEMQLPSGAYRVAVPTVSSEEKVVVFDMGQDLLGMTQAFETTQDSRYQESSINAATFLCDIQESDGSWIKHTFGNTTHTYHTRVAWGLLKVHAISGIEKFKQAAILNLEWASQNQFANGWLDNNHFPPPHQPEPFTHAISYAIEGFLWSGLLLQDPKYIKIALRAALPLAKYYLQNNFLPGTFNHHWHSDDNYSCLTGNAQLSLVWLTLFSLTKDGRLYQAGIRMNEYLKRQQHLKLPFTPIRGAIGGSDPLWGDLLKGRGYCRLAYPNWATKFFLDALLAEDKILLGEKL